jgi:hypothetical protein
MYAGPQEDSNSRCCFNSLETNYYGAKFMSVAVTVPYETELDFYGFRVVVSRGM